MQFKIIFILILCTVSFGYGQKKMANPEGFIQSQKKKVDQTWIRENPTLKPTKSSFFNKNNEHLYFVGIAQISGENRPFSWDDDLSFLQYLLNANPQTTITGGKAADDYFKGTKVRWNNTVDALLVFDNQNYKTAVDYWHLGEVTECAETIIFPNLFFTNVSNLSTSENTGIQGLVLLPYSASFKVKSSEVKVITQQNQTISGMGYDIDNDVVWDVFIYVEEIDESASYTRLYRNISGQWICTGVHLDQECV